MMVRHRILPVIAGISLMSVLAACGGTSDTDGEPTTTAPGGQAAASSTAPPETVVPPNTSAPAATTTTSSPTLVTTTTETPGLRIEIVVSSGTVEAPQRPVVARGDLVTIVVVSDTIDEVHVHGYDLFADIGPEAPTTIEFMADIPGIFEVELESSHLLLLELEVG